MSGKDSPPHLIEFLATLGQREENARIRRALVKLIYAKYYGLVPGDDILFTELRKMGRPEQSELALGHGDEASDLGRQIGAVRDLHYEALRISRSSQNNPHMMSGERGAPRLI